MVTATGPAPGSDMMTSAEPAENRTASGVLYVAPIFASHMVLQRNKPIVVFGALNADCAGLEVTAAICTPDGSPRGSGARLRFDGGQAWLLLLAHHAAGPVRRRPVHTACDRGQRLNRVP